MKLKTGIMHGGCVLALPLQIAVYHSPIMNWLSIHFLCYWVELSWRYIR